MHPVLVYAALFISTTIGLLFLFENYQLGSAYLLFLIAAVVTGIIGKTLIKLFPSDDPMQDEIEKEERKQRANQYKREIQYLFNIVQPDPKLQPNPKRLGASLADCFDLDIDTIVIRLKQHFGDTFSTSVKQPIPDMVEEIKQKYKNWPES